MFHRTVAVAMFAGLLASCASQPVPDAQTRAVPPDRISAPKYLDPAPNTGTVTVKRDSGFMGGGCAFQLMDAAPVADLRTAERVVLHLPLGDHVLSVQPHGICSGGVPEVQAHVTAAAPLSFRIGVGSSGDLAIYPTKF